MNKSCHTLTQSILIWNDYTFGGKALPSANNAHDLGSPTVKWKNGYFSGIIEVDGQVRVGDPGTAGDFIKMSFDSGDDECRIARDGSGTTALNFDASGNIKFTDMDVTFGGKALPSANNAHDLGSPTVKWKNGYFSDTIEVDGQVRVGDPGTAGDFIKMSFDSGDDECRIARDGSGTTALNFDASGNIKFTDMDVTFGGDALPGSDDSRDLGSPSLRWQDIYTNGAVTTSDADEKTDITDLSVGLDVLKDLRPVSFCWKDVPEEVEEREIEETVPVTELKEIREKYTEIIDGKAFRKTRLVEKEVPVYDEYSVFDEQGLPVLDKDGNQKIHKVPRTETVKKTVSVIKQKGRTYSRDHWGLIAQEVKEVLDNHGIDSGVFIDPAASGKEGSKGIRYHELIAVMIKSIQELSKRVEDLENA